MLEYMQTVHKITHTTIPIAEFLFNVMQTLPCLSRTLCPPWRCSYGMASQDDWTWETCKHWRSQGGYRGHAPPKFL